MNTTTFVTGKHFNELAVADRIRDAIGETSETGNSSLRSRVSEALQMFEEECACLAANEQPKAVALFSNEIDRLSEIYVYAIRRRLAAEQIADL